MMEYYLATKKNEVLINTTTWLNLESIMTSEEANHKRQYIMISFTRNVQDTQICRL